MCNKTKETEEQLPKHSQQEGLLMDMKSHTESIWYRISGLSHLAQRVADEFMPFGDYDTFTGSLLTFIDNTFPYACPPFYILFPF